MWVVTFGVATGEEAWELYVNMWGMKKGGWQVFGLDSHPFIGNRIWVMTGKPGPFRSYSVETG